MKVIAGLVVSLLVSLSACSSVRDAGSGRVLPHMPADLSPAAVKAADEFLWLEEVEGQRALAWVKEQNTRTDAVLKADPRYEGFRRDALAILTAQDRIPSPRFRAGGIDNFWQDAGHVRGVWRRTTLESYRSGAPQWETVLDIDALAKAETANWIYKGASCLDPDEVRCLVSLSDGGKDAVVVREYDTAKKAFVEGGFSIPTGKHRISWLDADTLLVATDFGPGTLTESGYPFIVKALKRGETLAQAREIYRGDAKDGGYGVSPSVLRNGAGEVLAVLVSRPLDTFRSETWLIKDGRPVQLNLPERVTVHGAMGAPSDPLLVFSVEQAWDMAKMPIGPGVLLRVKLNDLSPGDRSAAPISNLDPFVLVPEARQSVGDVRVFDDRIVVSLLDNVRGRAVVLKSRGEFKWERALLPAPENSAVQLGSSSRSSGRMFYTYEGFLTPSTLALADVRSASAETVRAAPARFDVSGHVVEQFEAVSRDGTKVPYFVTRPKAAKMDGSTPTLMFGYGGFQVSYPPAYKPEMGKLWLEQGGAYVVANIRGGGEFGPEWHQAALNGDRQRAFDDFAAVAEDIAKRKITSPEHLAIYGRSNGGVLTSVTLTQRPEIIGGAVIESPLVDMLRYHDLPPGASWMGEYGDPRIPEEAAWIAAYSAYQNLQAGAEYPKPYITTNMRDDRVHPGHARKFAARMQAMGYDALYYENTDGGHSNDSDPLLNAERWARHYVYLSQALAD